ncbi:MAG: type II toxin-antitoxin system RelE/ParE family toxin [Pseudomonadota bacterium]|nr:type II toxin-antitoxin system RelE/ParE family toxin [Pseudomonadota bacterium]
MTEGADRYALSPSARADLVAIWRYSAANWSVEQADRYVRDLEAVFRLLAGSPGLGVGIDHLRKGYRKFPAGRHSVYYTSGEQGVLIVRILHQRMDAGAQLPGAG